MIILSLCCDIFPKLSAVAIKGVVEHPGVIVSMYSFNN